MPDRCPPQAATVPAAAILLQVLDRVGLHVHCGSELPGSASTRALPFGRSSVVGLHVRGGSEGTRGRRPQGLRVRRWIGNVDLGHASVPAGRDTMSHTPWNWSSSRGPAQYLRNSLGPKTLSQTRQRPNPTARRTARYGPTCSTAACGPRMFGGLVGYGAICPIPDHPVGRLARTWAAARKDDTKG